MGLVGPVAHVVTPCEGRGQLIVGGSGELGRIEEAPLTANALAEVNGHPPVPTVEGQQQDRQLRPGTLRR